MLKDTDEQPDKEMNGAKYGDRGAELPWPLWAYHPSSTSTLAAGQKLIRSCLTIFINLAL
jgi:hypothetical protein